MSGIVLRWGVPAFVVVVGGTYAALATTGERIHDDLTTRIGAELAANGITWPRAELSGRDVTLVGAISSPSEGDLAAGLVTSVPGVRSVALSAPVVEQASPYPLVLTVRGDTTTVSGGVPDDATRSEVLSLLGAGAKDETQLLAGVPDRTVWLDGIRYLTDYAAKFDEGEAALSGLNVTISGRAKNYDAFDDLTARAELNPPAGLHIGFREVTPPLASPYEFRAEYDGVQLSLSGAVPDQKLIDNLSTLSSDAVPVKTSLVLASGAPEAFDEKVATAARNLLKLHDGSFTISDDALTFSGTPEDQFVGQEVRVAMTPMATAIDLAPAPVAEYWFGIEKSEDGLKLEGYVPDEVTKSRLEALPEADGAELSIGGNAPDRFVAGVDFVVDLVSRFSSGSANIQGTTIILRGRAQTSSDFNAVREALDQGAPQGFTLGSVDLLPPIADPYLLTIARSANGEAELTGYVPDDSVRQAIVAALPKAEDKLTLADGAPGNLQSDLGKAMPILGNMPGEIRLDAAGWTLSIDATDANAAKQIEDRFAASGLADTGWQLKINRPEPVEAAIDRFVSPYLWQADKAASGAATLSGFVPSVQLRDQLIASLGDVVTDDTALANGAPPEFAADTEAALSALSQLREGSVFLRDDKWTISGAVASTSERHAIEKALRAVDPDGVWTVAIQADDAAPLVVPFTWQARKTEEGRYEFAGYVPTEQLRRFLAVRAGKVSTDSSLIGSGEPEGFAQQALSALEALGKLTEGSVRYDGRNWTLEGLPESETAVDQIAAVLAPYDGKGPKWTTELLPVPETPAPVEATTVEEPAAAPEQPFPTVFAFRASKAEGEGISFAGTVPDEAEKTRLAAAAPATATDALEVGGNLPANFGAQAALGEQALGMMVDGEFGLSGAQWALRGRVETDAAKRNVTRLLASAPEAWRLELDLLPPLDLCRRHVAGVASRNAILFQSGSATMDDASGSALDELAKDLSECPTAIVNVEGHTDSDGDADQNLALSVSRAEAVVDALIARGVDPARLYAVGYGESLPIASNDTRAGKQANRRIAFTISEP